LDGVHLTMILNETLRLFPPILEQNKQATMDMIVGDLYIPKEQAYIFLDLPFTMTLNCGE